MSATRKKASPSFWIYLVVLVVTENGGAITFLDSAESTTSLNDLDSLVLSSTKKMLFVRSNEVVLDNIESESKVADSPRYRRKNSDEVIPLDVGGKPSTGYFVAFLFGTPKTMFNLMIDTGSSNTGIIAYSDPKVGSYYQSTSYTNLHLNINITYTVGGWSGYQVEDVVYLTDQPSRKMSAMFALIQHDNRKFFIEGSNWQGILGMAYSSLVQPNPATTFWDQVREVRGLKDSFSLKLCPPLDYPRYGTVLNEQRSYMDLGGHLVADRIRNISIHFSTPLDRFYPQMYYSVVVTDITVGNRRVDMDCKKFNIGSVILDSGTTDIYFPVDVFNRIKDHLLDVIQPFGNITRAELSDFFDGQSKLAFNRYSLDYLFTHLPPLRIGLPSADDASRQFYLVLPPQLYLQETTASIEEELGTPCSESCDFFYFAIKKRDRGTVIGALALMGFYINFDRENFNINFWLSSCEYLVNDTVILPELEEGPHRDPSVNCSCHDCPKDSTAEWLLVMYILPGVAVILMGVSMQAVHTRYWLKDIPRLPGCCTVLRLWAKESMFCGLPKKVGQLGRCLYRKLHQEPHYTHLVQAQEETESEGGVLVTSNVEGPGFGDGESGLGEGESGLGDGESGLGEGESGDPCEREQTQTSTIIVGVTVLGSEVDLPSPRTSAASSRPSSLLPRTTGPPEVPTDTEEDSPLEDSTSLLQRLHPDLGYTNITARSRGHGIDTPTDHVSTPTDHVYQLTLATPTNAEHDLQAPVVQSGMQDTTNDRVLRNAHVNYLVAVEEDIESAKNNVYVTDAHRQVNISSNLFTIHNTRDSGISLD